MSLEYERFPSLVIIMLMLEGD